MPKRNRLSLYEFQQRFGSEEQCRDFLEKQRWPDGFLCPKCGGHIHCRLSNGVIQCGVCRHQISVTAGTVMRRSHLPLRKWFWAMYFMSQNKRGRGTEKAKVLVALSLTEAGHPQYLKMKPTENIKQASVKRFAQVSIEKGSVILSNGYRSYAPALTDYDHRPKTYDPENGMLRWPHIMIGNAKAFILDTYYGLPQKYLGDYLNEFCFRFSFGEDLFDRLALAVAGSYLADLKG